MDFSVCRQVLSRPTVSDKFRLSSCFAAVAAHRVHNFCSRLEWVTWEKRGYLKDEGLKKVSYCECVSLDNFNLSHPLFPRSFPLFPRSFLH